MRMHRIVKFLSIPKFPRVSPLDASRVLGHFDAMDAIVVCLKFAAGPKVRIKKHNLRDLPPKTLAYTFLIMAFI